MVEWYDAAAMAVERLPLQGVPPQRVRPIANTQLSIEMLVDRDPALRKAHPQGRGAQLERQPGILDRVVVGDRPLLLHREDAVEIRAVTRHERGAALRGREDPMPAGGGGGPAPGGGRGAGGRGPPAAGGGGPAGGGGGPGGPRGGRGAPAAPAP